MKIKWIVQKLVTCPVCHGDEFTNQNCISCGGNGSLWVKCIDREFDNTVEARRFMLPVWVANKAEKYRIVKGK